MTYFNTRRLVGRLGSEEWGIHKRGIHKRDIQVACGGEDELQTAVSGAGGAGGEAMTLPVGHTGSLALALAGECNLNPHAPGPRRSERMNT